MTETNADGHLKALIKKRGSIKSRLTSFDKYVKSFSELENIDLNRARIIELNDRITNIETILGAFEEIQSQVECEAERPDDHYQEREDFENKFYSVLANARSLLEELNVNNDDDARSHRSYRSAAHSAVGSVNADGGGVKLPEIELPKFNGSYETWMEFRDIFESLIHKNAQINNIQKFHYLRASLIGSATQVIQALEFNVTNYTIAWNTLCDRFNNKQLLIQNHIRAIFNTENIGAPSASKIRYVYESLSKHLSNLKQLGEPTDSWDTLLIYIISGKLDKQTAHEWEKHKANHDSTNLNHFKEFLKKRANVLETIEMNFEQPTDKPKTNNYSSKYGNKRFNSTKGLVSNTDSNSNKQYSKSKNYTCFNCKKDHSLFSCTDFLKLSIQDRINRADALQLCVNCLKRYRPIDECRWSGCKLCGEKHNTILHEITARTSSSVSVGQVNNRVGENCDILNNLVSNVSSCTLAATQNAILSTAKIQVRSASNDAQFVTARALLDCGSQSSFVTSDLCERLKLTKIKYKLAVSGISDNISYANYKCDLHIGSSNGPYTFSLSCFVLDKITTDVPDIPIDVQNINIPVNISLADPEFYVPQAIDVLIGADAFWQLLSEGRINLGSSSPILQNTRLGWIVAGPMTMPTTRTHCNLSANISVQDQLATFWEVEEIENKRSMSIEEEACEDHFAEHLSLSEDGRFIVSLPFKDSPSKLGESRETAIKRFVSLERRLMSNERLYELYTDFLSEYERLGHMKEIIDDVDNRKPEYFMPHHGVLKESSSSTKLRVVFNASSPTSTALSLNDLQMTGPIIQNDLFSIILRFRTRSIVLSSDIKMMYRQVLVNPAQRNLQKIIWRSNPSEPMKIFQLNTVTYGTTAASFLAIRCLHEVASECENDHPVIANVIRKDMYVDDLLTSLDTIEEAKYVCEHISQILLKHGFELRKWKSNDKNVIVGLNSEPTSDTVEFSSNKECESKTLGLSWESNQDMLMFKIQQIDSETRNPITKRIILSRIATIFDPLGLVSPCIVVAKVLLQKLWSENLTWDQPLPSHILDSWLQFSSELYTLNNLKIPRKITCDSPTCISLHGFADASETSYGACVYVVSKNSKNERITSLLCAKSKVAPIKPLTIPRLELCAALILSRLVSKTLESIDIEFDNVYCWSDSTIVLGWLRTPPNLLKPFVANRVAEVQRTTESFKWNHVPTFDNPADIISRGLTPKQLIGSEKWFHGPRWLSGDPNAWPNARISMGDLPEKRKQCLGASTHQSQFVFERFSTLDKLKRIFAYVLRFITRARTKSEAPNLSYITVDERNSSFIRLIKIAQRESFGNDCAILQRGNQLPPNSKILSLHPFLDDKEILRVGGRLTNSDYPYSKKHPILLSPSHHLTKLIFEDAHVRLLHAGPQLLLSSIRDAFWPISGRNFAKKIVRSCVICARYDARSVQPLMGELPKARVQPSTPFTTVGVDYAGPFTMKDKRTRGCKPIKCWVALFVCFSTRAIHLELVLSLCCDDFLQAFNRFISRRGRPREVFSDNGTNFTKANKELQEMARFILVNSTNICESAASLGVTWHFLPVNSPHFGGIWEAGVKSLKHHLKRVVGNHILFFFDFQTLLIRVEAVLNSRPLFPLSSNPDDLTALSPAHFLVGRPATSLPEPSTSNVKENRLSQYQRLQRLYEHFWDRWSREYLSELQQRRRWKKGEGSLVTDQLVVIKDDNLPPTKWRLGRVLKLIVGKDGLSRVATVKTADGTTTRAVSRLCPLPVVS